MHPLNKSRYYSLPARQSTKSCRTTQHDRKIAHTVGQGNPTSASKKPMRVQRWQHMLRFHQVSVLKLAAWESVEITRIGQMPTTDRRCNQPRDGHLSQSLWVMLVMRYWVKLACAGLGELIGWPGLPRRLDLLCRSIDQNRALHPHSASHVYSSQCVSKCCQSHAVMCSVSV